MPEASGEDISWRKSSHSYPEHCVEFACLNGVALVRDSQNKNIGLISVSGGEWMRLASATRSTRTQSD
ncbi:DUF397 domain-containing protein [Nocardiopsis metallicus]|uniref:DUF397 domain-containing protein n=1 Tax=Nocardiopsis metallicus TaxID=179819 RepID=A0A840WAQ8_9ACTN|nr:DUF397 domain-containing protein [Nocardiopsis metallicus]MBB5493234.1 hypothetical protein [Nocardiopsis metallicus]